MTRTSLLPLLPLLASLLLVSCGDAGTRYQTSDGPCGAGEQSALIPELLCVYPQAVVIETGFECPAQAANRFDHGDVTLCSADPNLSPQQQEDIVRDFRDRHPELQVDCSSGANPCPAGLRCQDQLCIPDDACTDGDGDGFCSPDDCDDADATIFPGAPELEDGRDNDCDGQAEGVTCTLDIDCPEAEACVRGVCAAQETPCASDAECADTEYCATALQVCRACPDGECGTCIAETFDGVDNDCDGLVDECAEDAECGARGTCVRNTCVAR